jgi:uncharacterized peroxidase-related enzyme
MGTFEGMDGFAEGHTRERDCMPRLRKVESKEATGKVKELYDAIDKKMGQIPNIFKGLANSPVALQAYLALDDLIENGELTPQEQQIVRLVTSQYNGCDYCLGAHTMVGKQQGLSDEQMIAVRRGDAKDPAHAALGQFTRRVLETKGFVTDNDINAFRNARYTDAQMLEVVTIMAQKTLSNYFNHIHQTELDFPQAPEV